LGCDLNYDVTNRIQVIVTPGTRDVDSEIISESGILVSAEDFSGGGKLRIL
jgi:hypothetical protein